MALLVIGFVLIAVGAYIGFGVFIFTLISTIFLVVNHSRRIESVILGGLSANPTSNTVKDVSDEAMRTFIKRLLIALAGVFVGACLSYLGLFALVLGGW